MELLAAGIIVKHALLPSVISLTSLCQIISAISLYAAFVLYTILLVPLEAYCLEYGTDYKNLQLLMHSDALQVAPKML